MPNWITCCCCCSLAISKWQRRFHFTTYYNLIYDVILFFSGSLFGIYLDLRLAFLLFGSGWVAVAVIIMWVHCNTSNDFCCRLRRRNDIDMLHNSVYLFVCAPRTFAKFFLLDSCGPHSVSFWFVSYDTITKQRERESLSLSFSIVHFLFFVPLLSFTPEYRRAYALTIKHIIMECEKRCFIIHFIHVCSRIFIHGTFSNSSFFCCILECMVYSFWLDTLNIRNKKDANKYKSENVWSARIVARAHSWEWKKKQNGERTGKLPPNYEEKRKLRKVKEIGEGWWWWWRESRGWEQAEKKSK